MKKVVKSKVAAQKWLWWSDNGKNFNNNSGEFWCRFPVGGSSTNSPELLLLKFCHYQTTSRPPPLIPQLFSCCFFYMGCTFFNSLVVFCVDNDLQTNY